MPEPDLVIRSRRVVTPEGTRPAAVTVRDGRIVDVSPHEDAAFDDGGLAGEPPQPVSVAGRPEVHDVGDLVVMPGLVDAHVHVNEPGRTHWEGFATATRAAAVGGITTIVDMPLNSLPPTTTLAALTEKREAAAPQASVDIAFWGGAVPGNDQHLAALLDAGVSGFKAFLADSGVDEYAYVEPAGLAPLVARCFELGATLIVHAEHPDPLTDAAAAVAADVAAGRRDLRAYRTWLDSRPAEAEERAIAGLVAAARGALAASDPDVAAAAAAAAGDVHRDDEYPSPGFTSREAAGAAPGGVHRDDDSPSPGFTSREAGAAAAAAGDVHRDDDSPSPGFTSREAAGAVGREAVGRGRVHVLHLSAASAGGIIAQAKADGVPITAETCPHYLTLAAEHIPDGATDHKCAPPIRDLANQDRLWELLGDGTIDAIVSDHSPCPPEDKQPDSGDLLGAWGGIASLQLGLSLVWTQARARGFGLDDVVGWMAAAPARIAGLDGKGAIEVGADADLVVFDPDATWTVDRERLEHRHPITPYHGRELTGVVRRTYLGGHLVAQDGEVVGPPRGQLRRRSEDR